MSERTTQSFTTGLRPELFTRLQSRRSSAHQPITIGVISQLMQPVILIGRRCHTGSRPLNM